MVDEGARQALLRGGTSLLAAGVTEVIGSFDADDAVEVVGPDGAVFAKGLARIDAAALAAVAGRRRDDLPDGTPAWVVHRDDLVVLP
ncbi:MAG: PUA domain-containing protein [Acidimicrobiales bacterium]